MLKKFLHLAACLCLAAAGPALADQEMLPDALLYPGDRPGHILVVDKASQMLYLYTHDGAGQISLARVIRCSTGQNPGDKMVEGDKKTPDGFYVFNQKLLPRELGPLYGTLAYPTDYPNFWDKHLGRGGYGIWLHGTNKPMIDNDSSGCIALENADIAELEDLLKLFDTPLIIYESLNMALVDDLRREGLAVKSFLEDWRKAWSLKDHAAYRRKYAPEFVNSDARTLEGWMAHKQNVAGNYKNIQVELKNLRIFRHRDILVAAFEQDYQGDQRFKSVGLKRLYLKPEGGGYKIIGEEFHPLPSLEAEKKRLTPQEKRLALTTPPLTVATAATEPEPEDRRAVVEARAAAEDQARSGPAGPVLSEEGLPATAAEVRGSLALPPEPERPAEPPAKAAEPPAKAAEPPAKAAEPPAKAAEAKSAPAQTEPRFFTGLVEAWALAWAKKDQEAYFAFYHPDFHYKAKDLNLEAFKTYRSELMTETGPLEVMVLDFEVHFWHEQVRVAFRQIYRSDQLQDQGRKTLIFKKAGPDWKIISETWRAE